MELSRGERLRIGVVGLGRLWEARHKPALQKMGRNFQIVAVYDQVARRARMEAASLRCYASTGLRALVERSDLDAIHVLTPQWFGLHAMEIAAASGKAVYCAVPPTSDPLGLERAARVIKASGTLCMFELARRFYPATLRLRELLASKIGPPRLILGHNRLFGFDRYGTPGPTTQLVPLPLSIDPGSFLLDWARFVFDEEPQTIRATQGNVMPAPDSPIKDSDYLSFTIEFPRGGLAQIGIGRYDRPAWGEATRFLPQPGFQVFAERGAAWLEMPDRVVWSDSEGIHEERLPMEPTVGESLNGQFLRLVRGEPNLAPSLEDALAVIRMERGVHNSLNEGRVASVIEP